MYVFRADRDWLQEETKTSGRTRCMELAYALKELRRLRRVLLKNMQKEAKRND